MRGFKNGGNGGWLTANAPMINDGNGGQLSCSEFHMLKIYIYLECYKAFSVLVNIKYSFMPLLAISDGPISEERTINGGLH